MHFFDPVEYSLEENLFLAEHLGEPPVVALSHRPERVNVNAVKPILDRVYELIQLEAHEQRTWVGVDVLKTAAKTYLEQHSRWTSDKRRGAPKFPSLFSYDSKGRPHRQGPGSDSGKVSTYFDKEGVRQLFRVALVPDGQGEWVAEWATAAGGQDTPSSDGLLNDEARTRWECQVCHHTEHYKADSRSSQNAARARMSKHLRKTAGDANIDLRHREVHTNVFGQGA
jgi:hypothetical protein